MSDGTGGRHEAPRSRLRWGERIPRWAEYLTQLSEKILTNQGVHMAAIDDVNTAVTSLKDAVTTALNDLASRADAGSLSGADVRTVIGQLNTEHDAVVAAVAAVDNPPAPAAPADPNAPAAPADPAAPATA